MKLTETQYAGLRKILYTGVVDKVRWNTLRSLKKMGLVEVYNQMGFLTSKGADALNLPAHTTPDSDRVRALQNKIIDLALAKGIDLDMAVSSNMPKDITVRQLMLFIYPKWESEMNYILSVLENLRKQL